MKLKIVFFLFVSIITNAQEIEIYEQFNGRFDYTAIGNTLNQFENNLLQSFCETLPSSNATLNLDTSNTITAAYLFWAGSGNGDNDVRLNDQLFQADNIYNVVFDDSNWGELTYFSAVTDITDFIISQGNINYKLSDLDISQTLQNNPGYCGNRTNFAGWSIYVIYENPNLPLNQVSLFLGLDIINRDVQEKEIVIDNLNVLDNDDAKIGFLAWEGDNALNFGESLSINGNVLSSPPLNLATNAFNGTNSFTNSTQFYNCDLDVYNIENNINIGDTQAIIRLTTQADLIILNNIITVLNSQLPDGTTTINDYQKYCDSNVITIDYNVNNFNCTDPLPINTPIAFYANNILIGQYQTDVTLGIGETVNYSSILNIPTSIPLDFELSIVIDDNGNGISTINEISEINNSSSTLIELYPKPETIQLETLESCNLGSNTAYFNLESVITSEIEQNYVSLSYFENLEDLNNNTNQILDYTNYLLNNLNNTLIFIKAEKNPCFDILTIQLDIINCAPEIPGNIGISPNNDGLNDVLNFPGIYNVFYNHELLIFNRYGTLIFIGNNNLKWNGTSNQGINNGKVLPVGTYYYVLKLNESNFKAITGYIYLNK
ncbi:gliding motility-associated C-terminal domain-containing protein [Aurantibacter sp.]|uniref:T9SS type B sorting domain-containing protein n=1 Tax=Aurantibacter sp. TaxID=2807103 RepID=UPI0035C845CB